MRGIPQGSNGGAEEACQEDGELGSKMRLRRIIASGSCLPKDQDRVAGGEESARRGKMGGQESCCSTVKW